jgi:multiple sugar transport system substrate-binding protein
VQYIQKEENEMKRKIAIGLCASMILGMMAGCAVSAEETDENVKLTFWKSPHSDREDEIWASVIEKFNEEYPNIEVEFLNVAWDSVVEKETAAFAAGSGPDISFQTEQFPLYAKNGYLLSMDDYADEEKLAGYPESALEYCSYDGSLMGIPFVALNSVMFYNKDMFAAAGIEEVPTTWDELLEDAKLLTQDTDGDGEIDQWGMMFEMDDYWQPLSYIIQAGADQWNENLTNIGFNNEKGIEGLEFFNQLYNVDQVVLPLEKYTSKDEERSYLYNGQVAMMPQQIHYANIIREASDINLGAFALPAGPAEDEDHANWNFANIGMLSISSQTEHPDAAWKFVEFVTRPEIEKDYLSEVGFFSPQLATNDMMYEGDEIMAVAAESIKNLQVSPASDYANAMQLNLKTLYESVARGVATPEEAIQNMENTMKAISGE